MADMQILHISSAYTYTPLSHHISLKHKFKDEVIKNFKMSVEY